MARLYLLDGHSFAYQSFFALPNLTAPDGQPTGAVYGVVRVLRKVLRERAPEFVAVVFDPEGPTFRHQQFAAYKAERAPMPEGLRTQLPLIESAARTLGVATVRVEGYEADDVIGTLAARAAAAGHEVRILGKDKDFAQLLSEAVLLYDPSDDRELGPAWLREERGLTPAQVPDFLGLMGDAADGIPGVPGVGEKTARKLLEKFGSVPGVLAQVDAVTPTKLRDTLRTEGARLVQWVGLATIRRDVPLDLGFEALRPVPPDEAALRAMFARFGFRTLLAELAAGTPAGEAAPTRHQVVASVAALNDLVAVLRRVPRVALDTETTSADPARAELVGVSLCGEPGAAWYVPVQAPERERCLPRDGVVAALRALVAPGGPAVVGHNFQYDHTVLARAGVEGIALGFDTMLAAYLLNPGRLGLALESLAGEMLAIRKIPRDSLIGKAAGRETMAEAPLDQVAAYASEDADCTLRLVAPLESALAERGLAELYRTVELPLVPVLAGMERVGIALDAAALERLAVEVREGLAKLELRLAEVAGEPVNPRSPKQLAELLFGRLGLPVIRKNKTGPSTDADVLEELADKHPLPALLLEHRQLAKMLSTYLEALPAQVNPDTGRVHGGFVQTVAATGRLSSREPNLQNIPVRTELGRRIRSAFVAGGPDRRLVSADYSQVELRMLAHLSQDPALLAAFRAGADIHAAVASQLSGLPVADVTDRWRDIAKTVNFGIIYGQTPFGLSRQLKIPAEEAKAYIAAFFARHPGVQAFIERTIADARAHAEVHTMLGRRRQIPDIEAQNRDRRAAAERTAVNTVVQGSAADLIKLAMLRVDAALRARRAAGVDAALLVQIHDELLLETVASDAEALARDVARDMAAAMDLAVPLVVKTSIGTNWGEL